MNHEFDLMVKTMDLFEKAFSATPCIHTCLRGHHALVSHRADEGDAECDSIEDDIWNHRLICQECENVDAWQGSGTVEGLIRR